MANIQLHPSLELMMALSSHLIQHSPMAAMVRPLPPGFPPGPSEDLAVAFARDPLLCIEKLKAQYGTTVGFKLASQPVVLVSSPKLTKEVLVTKNKTFVKTGTAFFPGSSLTGNGLLVSDGEVWLRQRRLSNSAFRKCVVDTYAQVMVDLTANFVEEKWGQRCTRDVYADFNNLTMQVVATTLFGGFSGTDTFDEIGQAITTAFKLFTKRATSMFIVPEWFPTPDNFEYNSAVNKLDSVVYEVIRERRAFLARGGLNSDKISRKKPSQFQDLLTKLLQAKDDNCSGMSDRHLRDELMTLLVAGQETSAILLAWCMNMLALHPHLQHTIYTEINHVVGKGKPTHADLAHLGFTEAFILETMRLMPPAYIIGRCADQAAPLGRWEVPKGTTILIGIYLLHRDPLYWAQPLEFNPLRWLQDKHINRYSDNDSYWPFGGGPRTCIGLGFAMMEACLVLCVIVQKYKVLLPAGVSSGAKPRAMITLRPEDQVLLELVPRT